jgi:cell wall-associated NlpC family hydrolase
MGLARNLATMGCGVLSAAALAACGDAKVGTAANRAPTAAGTAASTLVAGTAAPGAAAPGAASPGTPAKGGASSAVGAKDAGTAREVADPQEASSFPAPASVQHASAAAPKKAGEAIVAAGAPSDAEVRKELSQMQAVERSAKQARTARLTPVPGGQSIAGSGALPIPAGIPEVVQKVIAGANEIADFPYVFGGGHGSFVDNAYDCSGSVSYALAAGGLLGAPETSGELESWGAPGPGRYITVLANAGHTYMYVDGVLYDTAGRSGVYASRWQVGAVDNSGFVARHWPGL